jgi:hypothetical protein
MNFDTNAISKLFDEDAEKANQLFRHLAKRTPQHAVNAIRLNSNLTIQLLFMAEGKIRVLSFPTITTDANTFALRVIGSQGDEIDNLAPIAFGGELLHQVFSTLVPTDVTDKFELPTLDEDPIQLDPPPPSTLGPGPGRLNVTINKPGDSPKIATWPATFALPLGFTAPTQAKLNDPASLTEEDVPCEAALAWIRAAAYAIDQHGGKPIHSDPTIFIQADLNGALPFDQLEMAKTIEVSVTMLNPVDPQHAFVLDIARAHIKARQQLKGIAAQTGAGGTTADAAAAAVAAAAAANNGGGMAAQLAAVVTAAVSASAAANKPKVTRAEKEADSNVDEIIARYQLMFASIENEEDPHNPGAYIKVVKFPEISREMRKIIETTKLSDATRTMQEQFAHHLNKRSESRLNQDTNIDYNIHSLDATTVNAVKRAIWNDEQLSMDPKSIQSKLGVYTFSPHSADSKQWQERVEAGRLIFRQESVGEDKSRINAKQHALDYSGRMITVTDLHATVANMWAMCCFVCNRADHSEMWKMVVKLQLLWHHTSGKRWLQQNRGTRHLICCMILEVQGIIGSFVEIANSMEYRNALLAGDNIDPRAYMAANQRSRDIIETNYRMISRGNLGDFVMEPPICKEFQTIDLDSGPAAPPPATPPPTTPARNRGDAGGRDSGRNGSPNTPTGRGNGTPGRGAGAPGRGGGARNASPPAITQDEITALKLKGLIKYTGSERRIPCPVDIYERNGSAGLTKLCMNFVVRERYCRYGNNCQFKHVPAMSALTTENKEKFQNFISNHNHFVMANPGTP